MAPSANTDSSPSIPETPENDLQSIFVLHRGCTQGSSKKLSSKSRRKINLSPTPCNNGDYSHKTKEACKDDFFERLRMEAFDFVWLKIESTIKVALRNISTSVFEDVYHWVHESFQVIRSSRPDGLVEATWPYPVITNVSFKLVFTGLVFTKTMEFVDNMLMFEELGLYLKSQGCYVAKLSSLDFTTKHGIGGCLRSLVRQLLMVSLNAADMSILASWYSEQREYNNPIVIIIEDVERCCPSILSDFIMMLSEWAIKIPVVLIMGVATMFDAPTNILSSDALQRLHSFKFMLGSPVDIMDSILEAALLRPCTWFSVGHKVALFLRNYFSEKDGSLTSFIRALKLACVQHFITEPLSFLLKDCSLEDDFQHVWCENHVFPLDMVLKDAAKLPSCRRVAKLTIENLACGLAELKRLQKRWIAVVRCLHEAGKSQKIQLLDLYCEALDPGTSSPNFGCMPGQYGSFSKCVSISQVVRNVRELPSKALCELLESWEKITEDISEMHGRVRDLQGMLKLEVKSLASNSTHVSMRYASQSDSNVPKNKKALNEKALRLIEWMLRDCIRPMECMPFHEIICFTNVDKLKSALLGDPRRRIQADLSEFYEFLCCHCCTGGDKLSPSMHDTSIMYRLAREHGDIINLQQWYQTFRTTITHPASEGKKRLKHQPSRKKRKNIEDSEDQSEAAIQARFCRAVTELQILGLLRMPSKRRPDYVQTVAFGQYPL
ncbi:Origin recognition complex subunit 3 [Ancistrocladus abbreviatus]